MQEPLLSGDVWVAFDHVARLADAFNQKPDDFVAFPAPAGPTGRGFMPVVAGIAIPKTSPDIDKAKALVAYMMQPETQIATLLATNFFPVVDVDAARRHADSVKAFGPAIAAMTSAPDALPALLPIGLGDLGGKFNQVYTDTFERIVLGGQDVRDVLDEQAAALKALIDQAKAPCWAARRAVRRALARSTNEILPRGRPESVALRAPRRAPLGRAAKEHHHATARLCPICCCCRRRCSCASSSSIRSCWSPSRR